MADELTMRVVNGAELGRALDTMARDLAELRAPLEAAGAAWLAAARAAAPRRTGAMAAAHRGAMSAAGRWSLTVDHPAAAAVHWGWPAHNIRRQPWTVVAFHRQAAVQDRLAAGVQADIDREAGKVHR